MTNEIEVEEAWDEGLKARERIFILNYCTNESCLFNATASYKTTYTKKDRQTGLAVIPDQITCETNGSKMMKRPKVKAAIRKLLKIVQPELDEQNVYKVIKELQDLAFFNPGDIIDHNGRLIVDDIKELGEKAKAIAQIKFTQYGPSITLVDRTKYLDLLMKYLNIVRPEQQIDIKLPVIEMVQKAQDVDQWNTMSEQQEEK